MLLDILPSRELQFMVIGTEIRLTLNRRATAFSAFLLVGFLEIGQEMYVVCHLLLKCRLRSYLSVRILSTMI